MSQPRWTIIAIFLLVPSLTFRIIPYPEKGYFLMVYGLSIVVYGLIMVVKTGQTSREEKSFFQMTFFVGSLGMLAGLFVLLIG